ALGIYVEMVVPISCLWLGHCYKRLYISDRDAVICFPRSRFRARDVWSIRATLRSREPPSQRGRGFSLAPARGENRRKLATARRPRSRDGQRRSRPCCPAPLAGGENHRGGFLAGNAGGSTPQRRCE